MDASTDDADGTGKAAALPPMALLATLQTATTVWEGIEERRTGRDPAAQESAAGARAYLRAAAGELMHLHMQLLMANVQARRSSAGDGPAPPPLSAPVRRFDMLMKLRRAGRLLHGAHQRLMSLYPEVSEELVEEARRCRSALGRLHDAAGAPDADHFGERLGVFLQRLLSFAAWLEREL